MFGVCASGPRGTMSSDEPDFIGHVDIVEDDASEPDFGALGDIAEPDVDIGEPDVIAAAAVPDVDEPKAPPPKRKRMFPLLPGCECCVELMNMMFLLFIRAFNFRCFLHLWIMY